MVLVKSTGAPQAVAEEQTPMPSPHRSLGASSEPAESASSLASSVSECPRSPQSPDHILGSHTALAVKAQTTVERLQSAAAASSSSSSASILLDGHSLTIADVVAATRYATPAAADVTPALEARLAGSIRVLDRHLDRGWTVYGVNTGYGGSADVRTDTASRDAMRNLQLALLQHQQSGIIPASERTNPLEAGGHTIPRDWVRAAMLVRANQNLRGHSAVRLSVIQRLLDMLRDGATPVIPLRGTVSASGDLQPLAYIAGALTGNPDILVQLDSGGVLSAAEYWAQRAQNNPRICAPLQLEPKEALGLINGTAPSAALASLALHEAHQLAVLAQMLTALAAEGLGANVEWAHDFVHRCRPHPGQREAAANLRWFLRRSRLVIGLRDRRRTGDGLWQDRYSTRTAPQWFGPYLEDLVLAERQVETELNSTSDNPLIMWGKDNDNDGDLPASDGDDGDGDDTGDVFSGGNFQATSITSAMDKARLALQMVGRILFSQVAELVNPAANNGLPANLSAVDSGDFAMKGIDINVAAYMAELASLAHPVSSHVLPAELGNQGVNSLAFITGRRTMEAVDVLAHICACHAYVACQAVELRVLNNDFLAMALGDEARRSLLDHGVLGNVDTDPSAVDALWSSLASVVRREWNAANSVSWPERCRVAADAALAPVVKFAADMSVTESLPLVAFRAALETHLFQSMADVGLYPLSDPEVLAARARARLGAGTARLHEWVRARLNVPTHMGRADDPVIANKPSSSAASSASGAKTVGSRVSVIYDSIRDGGLTGMVVAAAARKEQREV